MGGRGNDESAGKLCTAVAWLYAIRKLTGQRLPWRDDDLHCSVRPKNIAFISMLLRVPVPNTSADLTEKVKAELLGQVPEVTDQIGDGMLFTSATVPLKNRDRVGGPGDVVSFVHHASLDCVVGQMIKPAPSHCYPFCYPTR